MEHISEIIDDILTEWAYQVNDGMPNPKNPHHLVILEQSMNNLDLPEWIDKEWLLSELQEAKATIKTLPVKEIITMVRDTVSSKYSDFKVQTQLLSWVIPDADDTDSFEKTVKFLKGNSKIKDYVSDVKLLKPGKGNAMKPAWYSVSSDGISNTFPYVGVKVKNTTDEKKNGHWLHFKLSAAKKGSGGAPRDAARYEEGLVLFHNAHNKHKGDYNAAVAKSKNYGIGNIKTFETYLPHMKENFDDKSLWSSNNFGTLYHSGKSSYSVKGEYYTNKTPKTDIYSDSMNISVKKGKGSQLMSGKSGDAQGVFMGALQHYLNTGGNTDLTVEVEKIIGLVESSFDSITGPTGARDIKKNFGTWYIKERTKDSKLKKEAEKIRDTILKKKEKDLTADDKDMLKRLTGKTTPKKNPVTYGIERHAKWEAMAADMIDKTSSMADWEIKGITIQTRSMENWLNTYIKTLPEELRDESKDVISLTQIHEMLQDGIGAVFDKPDFKKWIVYESATGFYKFEGEASTGNSKPSSKGAADTMLVFDPGNPATVNTTVDMDVSWAKGKASGVSLNVGFKSSKSSKFTALRLLQSHLEKEGNILTESEQHLGTLFEYDMDKIFNGELSTLTEEISFCSDLLDEMVLLEGIFSKIKGRFKSGLSTVKKLAKKIKDKLSNAIAEFWEAFKSKVIGKLLEYLKKGWEFFMDALGLQVSASSYSVSI